MEEARRSSFSGKMKRRWADCEEIARRLGVTKNFVFDNLYSKIADLGILEGVKEGDEEAMRAARLLCEDARPVRVHQPDAPLDEAGRIRIALWFISKIGSASEAVEAVKAAAHAVEKLKGGRDADPG